MLYPSARQFHSIPCEVKMDYEQLQQYQQSLLDRAITEALKRNSEQTETWSEYKKRHEKVKEGLEIFVKELSVNCMVPIGKKALMRGKLTHTNEILASLGDGYFAQYSSAQAVELCERRIKRADRQLDALEKERALYEMRQRIPGYFGAFGTEDSKDLIEHWDDEKLDDWREKHRQREKEYRQKLAESKKTGQTEVKTEDDLFAKLDALELQEELEAEIYRLEAKRPDYYDQDLGEDEVYEESEGSSEYTEDEEDEPSTEKLEFIGVEESYTNGLKDDKGKVSEDFFPDKRPPETNSTFEHVEKNEEIHFESSGAPISGSLCTEIDESESKKRAPVTKSRKYRSESKVNFGEHEVKYFRKDEVIDASLSEKSALTVHSLGQDSDNDEIARIEFKHSDFEPNDIPKLEGSINSPRDIVKMISKPKSILKNSVNSEMRESDNLCAVDKTTDDEIDYADASSISAYNTIVRDIKETSTESPAVESIVDKTGTKRPVSKFKRDRAMIKK